MKKTLLTALVGLLLCTGAIADPYDVVQFDAITAVTNATDTLSDTNRVVCNGNIEAVILDIGGYASATVDVDIVTSADYGTRQERTILSLDNVAADATYYPSVLRDTTAGVDVTGAAFGVPVFGDRLVAKVCGANTNTATLGIKILLRRR